MALKLFRAVRTQKLIRISIIFYNVHFVVDATRVAKVEQRMQEDCVGMHTNFHKKCLDDCSSSFSESN